MRKKLLAAAGAVVLAAALAAVPAGGPAAAAEPGPAMDTDQDPIATGAQAYRNVYPQMSISAARLAAAQQGLRMELHKRLVREPSTYGGSYFDPPSGVAHVTLTTAAAAAAAERYGRELGLTVQAHVVARSFVELWGLAESLRAGTGELGAVAKGQVGVDVASNKVTVALTDQQKDGLSPGAVPPWAKIVPASTAQTELDVCTDRANCDTDLRAGISITRNGAGCSLGFMARSTVRWALTAGHCADPAGTSTWSTNGSQIGSLSTVNALNSGAVDAGAIQVTDPTYAADTVGRIYIGSTSWVGVDGWADTMSAISVNNVVCISARFQAPGTFGNPCAVVTNTSDPTNQGLVRYEGYDPCSGDSGGGVYQYYTTSPPGVLPVTKARYAFGLHSRSTTGCNVTVSPVAWFSALPQFWSGLTYDLG
jgi:streptogrisin C